MNRIYRLVWNPALHQPQVTSELARAVHGNRNGGSAQARGPRYRRLALACAVALGVMGLSLSASAQNVPGSAGGGGGGGYAGQGGIGNGGGGGGGTGALGANNNGSPSSSGNGGAGGHSGYGLGAGGAGGNVGATSIGSISIHGGDGINGAADPSPVYASGGGGGGGDGVYSSDSVLSLGAGRGIIGGDGGSGAEGDRIGGGGGGGGAGLVTAAAAAAITNAGSIAGGHAGHGSSGQFGGGGGGGGDGLLMLGGGTTFSNTGSIVGGDGGAAGGGQYAGGVGAGGIAVNVASDGNVIANAGVLGGGMAGDGVTRANAIQISGAHNTLELRAGSNITGNVVSSGADNTLSLGGDVTDGTTRMDVSIYSGFASYQKTGASNWTLTGTDSASRNWTISAGTLTGDSHSVAGDVVDNAALVLNQIGNGTHAGVISGSGSLTKMGAGLLTLTGSNTYNGGTTISAGTLQGDTSSLQGDITNDAVLDFTQSGDGTFAGAISGSGGLTKQGAGVLILRGANRYTGGTTIGAGTLQGDTGSLQGSIVDNAALVFDQVADGVFAGSISGAGNLAKNGAGTLTFSGDNRIYSGHAEVSAGGVAVDGTLGGTLVMAANTHLSGSGTLGNLDLAGTLAPGHSIGTLSASSDVVIRSGASYEVETDAAGHSDLFAIAGHATLEGGSVLNLASDGSYAAHTSYTILTAADGVTGQFADVTSSLAFLDPTLVYQANAVQLILQRNQVDFCAVAITANQCATGTAVQEQVGGPLNEALVTQDAATARAALGQWSGESLASTRSALLEGSRFVREAMNDRLHRADTAQDTGRAIGETAASVWVHGWDHSGHADSDGNASKSQSSGSGLLLGVDAPLGDYLRAGVTAGRGQDALQVDALDSSARMKSNHLGLYAGGTWGAWALDGGVAESWHDIRSTRHVDAVLPDTLHADYHGRTRQAYIEGGYRIATAHGSLQPFVNLAHVAAYTGNVNEYGGITALRSEGETTEASFGTIGVHGLWSLFDNAATSIYGTLGWRHAVGDLVPLAQQHFADGERFTVSGAPLVAHAAVVQAGIDFTLSTHSSVRAGYDGVLAGSESDHAVRMTWQMTF